MITILLRSLCLDFLLFPVYAMSSGGSRKRARLVLVGAGDGDVAMSSAASSALSQRRRKRALGAKVPRDQFGVAQKFQTRLLYADMYQLNTGATTAAGQAFRISSLFDPDLTGIGHQPRYFDQLAALYDRYRVDAVTVEAWCSTTHIAGFQVSMVTWDDEAGLAPVINWSTAGEVQQVYAPKSGVCTSDHPLHLQQRFELSRVFGKTKAQHASDDLFEAVTTTNPINNAVCTITGDSLDQTVGEKLNVAVRLKFECTFWDRTDPGQS